MTVRVPLLLSLAFCVSAHARPKPDFDAFVQSSVRTSSPVLGGAARERFENGHLSQMEPRLGVPTFFWVDRSLPASKGPALGVSTLVASGPTGGFPLPDLGVTPEQAARRYLFDYAELYRFQPEALARAPLAKVHNLGQGAIIVEFRRELSGVPVYRDAIKVILNQKLEAIALSGYLSPLDRTPRGEAPEFKLAPEAALGAAFADLAEGELLPTSALVPSQSSGDWQWYEAPGFATPRGARIVRAPRTRPVLYALPDGLVPAFHLELEVEPAGSSSDTDFVAYVVSALDGQILSRKNLTDYEAYTYRVWADAASKLPQDGPHGNGTNPHPAGTPNNFQPAFIEPQLVTLQNFPFSRNDPWLPPAATTTNGNNAIAYSDIATPNGFGANDVQPTTTAANTFDRRYDTAVTPYTAAQEMAGATQLFYDVNFFHDWYYDLGFGEKDGNGQADNFGRGGLGNDPILAEAQDYSGNDNANMSTPSDGSRGRMQMYTYLPNPDRTVQITAPQQATLSAEVANFGFAFFDVTAQTVLAVDGTDPVNDGCTAYTNAAAVAGKIALVDSTGCKYVDKLAAAQAAGAAGVIVMFTSAAAPEMGGFYQGTNLPILGVGASGTQALKAGLANGTTVRMFRANAPSRDGSLDTGIVAHEWGHFISNRLVGDATGLVGLQGKSMGEGVSDVHALLLTVRAEDVPLALTGAFNAGSYAGGGYGPEYYFGVRRVPYSVDLNKNGLMFRHISNGFALPNNVPTMFGLSGVNNAEFHNAGEVYATMLWDAYANLLASGRLSFTEAQSRMKQYMIEMYKGSPLVPTFLEMRDSLLAAASARDDQDFATFSQAFARRGAGFSAVAPPRESTDNKPITESTTSGTGARLVRFTLSDNGSSCDNDGFLDSGETGEFTLFLKNTGWTPLSGAKVKVSSTASGVSFPDGDVISFDTLKPLSTASAKIRINLLAGATNAFDLPLAFNLSAPGLPDSTANAQTRVNFDIAQASSRSDDVDLGNSGWTFAQAESTPAGAGWRRLDIAPGQFIFRGLNVGFVADTYLISPPLNVGTGAFSFNLRHRYSFDFGTEDGAPAYYDGGVIELSQDNGVSWVDIGASASPGYNASVYNANNGNVLAGRPAYTAQSSGYPSFIDSTVNLGSTYAGKTVRVRFRIASDNLGGLQGWDIDSVAFNGITNLPFPSRVANAIDCVAKLPKLVLGPGQSVNSGALVTLDATKSSDSEGRPLSFIWAQTNGPVVTLSNPTSASPTFTAPTVTEPTSVDFIVTATAGPLTSLPGRVSITVLPTDASAGGCGCTSASGSFGLVASMAALLALAGRRRRG